MSRSTKNLTIAFLAAALGLVGCQQEGAAEKAGQKIDKAATAAGNKLEGAKESMSQRAEAAGDYLDDAAITAKIKAEILGDPALRVQQISVTTTDGVVKLTGVVDSQQSIDHAVQLARDNRNVKSVDSGLLIAGAK